MVLERFVQCVAETADVRWCCMQVRRGGEQSCALEAPFSPLHSCMIGPEAGIVLPRTRATLPSLRDLHQFPGK